MKRNNFFALTGGPGGGKSSILLELSKRGFKVVEETARKVIKDRIQKGLSPRPEPDAFAREIFERDIHNFNSISEACFPVFFDRSFVDSAGMIQMSDAAQYKSIEPLFSSHQLNNRVFIAPPWKEIYQTDAERDQTYEQAIEVHDLCYHWYESQGYELVVLPKTSVGARIEFILREIGKLGFTFSS